MPAYPKSLQLAKGPSRRQSRSQARKVYTTVTEAARNADGFLVCIFCGLPGRDDEMDRIHRTSRGAGGATSVQNVAVAHHSCHMASHRGGNV